LFFKPFCFFRKIKFARFTYSAIGSHKNNIHVLSRAVIIDEDHILLCKTLDLSSNFYFLPGGHIEHGESAHDAVLRELLEEGGVQGTIKRFLGCLEQSFEPGHNSICHNHEYNFFFEVESTSLKVHEIIPQREEHIQLMWVPLTKIGEIEFRPEPLKTLLPEWLDCPSNESFKSEMCGERFCRA
jgi:8-oxo-dGTP diphosphatase